MNGAAEALDQRSHPVGRGDPAVRFSHRILRTDSPKSHFRDESAAGPLQFNEAFLGVQAAAEAGQ